MAAIMIAQIQVDDAVFDYAVRIARSSREWHSFAHGAGPRASIALIRAARAQALLDGREFVTPDDVKTMALPGLVLALMMAFFGPAWGHGSDEPQHGGIVQVVGDMSFELVNAPEGATVYMVEHGVDVDTSKLTGKIKIKSDPDAEDIVLTPAGGNMLKAGQSLPAGGKVLVIVTLENGYSRLGANFTVAE